jgi:hypothetical protein
MHRTNTPGMFLGLQRYSEPWTGGRHLANAFIATLSIIIKILINISLITSVRSVQNKGQIYS